MSPQDYLIDLAGIGISAAINVGFHILYNHYKGTYFKIMDAAVTELAPELLQKIKDIPDGFTACVYGTVSHSSSKAIRCENKPDITGVIHTHSVIEHIVTKVFGMWMNETQMISSNTNYVPFMLYKNGIEIQIENPSKLERFDLIRVNDVFEPVQNTVFQHLVGYMKNVQRTGIQRIDEMLVEGTKVMGIGRIISRNGILYLTPEKQLPYIVTTEDHANILEEAQSYAIFIRLMKFLSSLGTIYMIYRFISHIVKDRRRKKDIEEFKRLYNDSTNAAASVDTDEPNNSACVVCFSNRDVVLIPCGHVCVCSSCAEILEPKICPVCRERILFVQELYYS